ncbi:MAG: WGR domain-containing protein [Rhizonema sp. PD37]|nr:WGR domain-containing protein [Rhizonema sp. PD37]
MSSVTLYRIDPVKNMQRFYYMDIQPDFFGNQCLIREWGRIGRAGQMRTAFYPNTEEAEQALYKQRVAKQRKGYAECLGVSRSSS